jgi:2-polyprenyl-3-methyl-5-hydroxy-6-metoxy-1,4-benzoquinol methylase
MVARCDTDAQPMGIYLDFFVNILTLGNEGQSFLGARWVEGLLKITPEKYRRQIALTVLSWSPHYFYRTPDSAHLSHTEFTAREFARNQSSREKLCAAVLLPDLQSSQVVLDYGCGTGCLAGSVSRHVRSVYGVDLSSGVVACARILHTASNITFLQTTQLGRIEDGSVDLVYSFAVVQHVTDAVFRQILTALFDKLKSGGKLLIQIVLDEDHWRSEQDWKQDESLKGRLKWKYALNSFKRKEEDVRDLLETAGFKSVVIQPMRDLCPENFDDVCTQHLVRAVK